ncbi:MAG: hypothetical protein ABIG90_00190 [bacterium]
MKQNLSEILSLIRPVEPPAGLFDRIISAIEKKQARKTLLSFLVVLVVSVIAIPVSGIILANQIQNSGIFYFASAAISDLQSFFIIWQDFSLAILESLPITGITAFAISIGIALFTLRLFFSRKKILLNYLYHEQKQTRHS